MSGCAFAWGAERGLTKRDTAYACKKLDFSLTSSTNAAAKGTCRIKSIEVPLAPDAAAVVAVGSMVAAMFVSLCVAGGCLCVAGRCLGVVGG